VWSKHPRSWACVSIGPNRQCTFFHSRTFSPLATIVIRPPTLSCRSVPHLVPCEASTAATHPPRSLRPWRAKRHHHPGATRRSPAVALDTPLNLSLLAMVVPHKVGHGHRRRSVSSISDLCLSVSSECYKSRPRMFYMLQ
jgi:hypothetical protein